MFKNILSKFKITFIYLILIIYSVELCLFFYIPKEQKTMVYLEETRLKLAKEQKIEYDLRSTEEIFLTLRSNNQNIKPNFYYHPIFFNSETLKRQKKSNKIIPFRGPINAKSVSCTEDFQHRLIINDKYGFRNENNIYEKPIQNVILGDSYAEGFCVGQDEDIAGNLNLMGYPTANFAVGTTAPLVSLGVLREFGNILKPKNFIYFYFEGNDLEGLEWEKKQKDLIKYLDKDYKINYLEKYDEVNSFLNAIAKESIEHAERVVDAKKNNTQNTNNKIIGTTKDILEINNIRNILKNSIFKSSKTNYDLQFFYKVISEMDLNAKRLNSRYIFVYVPTWSRYFTRFTKKDKAIFLKDEILSKLKNMNIETLDLTEVFNNQDEIKQYFPLGYLGHFNAKGYKKISEALLKKL